MSLFFNLSAPPTFCFDRCFFFLNLFRMRERWCFCYALISNPSCVKSKNNNQSILKPPTKLIPFYGLKAYSFKTSLYQRLDHLMNNYFCVFLHKSAHLTMLKYQIKSQKSFLSSPYKIGAHVPTTRSSFTYFYVVTQCTHSTFLRERNIIFWEGSVCVCVCVKERERQGQIPQSLIIGSV